MPASPGGVGNLGSSGSQSRSPKVPHPRGADSPEEGEIASGNDDEDDDDDDDDDDAGDVPWIVDTRPRKERKRNKRSKHQSQSEKDAAQSSLPDFMTVDRAGSQAYKDDGQPPPPPPGDARGDDDAPQGDAESHDHTQHLLLPDHVKIQDQQRKRRRTSASPSRSPKPSRSPSPDTDAEGHLGDFTQLDADTSGLTRYYQAAQAEELKQLRVCEICGEKGHTKRQCSHLLCASCGAMDEHSTRDCPVGVSCFRCGQRGHRRNECTADIRRGGYRSRDCTRCGSLNHNENTCPTYWRIYAYVDEEQWQDFRADKARRLVEEAKPKPSRSSHRRSSSDMDTGDEDEDDYAPRPRGTHREDWDPATRWCYNCTAKGTHWGDDCPLPRRAHGRNGEPSIFSEFISMSGPFAYRLRPPAQDQYSSAYHDPAADMYDVSVGPNASMHFANPGGSSSSSSRQGARPPTIEEETANLQIKGQSQGNGIRHPDKPPSRGHPGMQEGTNGTATKPTRTSSTTTMGNSNGTTTMTTATQNTLGNGSSFNHRAKLQRQQQPSYHDDSTDGAPAALSKNEKKRQRKAALEQLTRGSVDSPIYISSSEADHDDDDDDDRLFAPPTGRRLTSRQLQSQRDKAAHAQRMQEAARRKEQNKDSSAFEDIADNIFRRPTKLAVDFSDDEGVRSRKKKKKKGKGQELGFSLTRGVKGDAGKQGKKSAKNLAKNKAAIARAKESNKSKKNKAAQKTASGGGAKSNGTPNGKSSKGRTAGPMYKGGYD